MSYNERIKVKMQNKLKEKRKETKEYKVQRNTKEYHDNNNHAEVEQIKRKIKRHKGT